MMVDPMFMIVKSTSSFIPAVTTTVVVPIAVISLILPDLPEFS